MEGGKPKFISRQLLDVYIRHDIDIFFFFKLNRFSFLS